jgi:hypothetical protein
VLPAARDREPSPRANRSKTPQQQLGQDPRPIRETDRD